MKAEQACRFRLDEGYCVFAKSPGIQPEQESVLGDIFNSNMNAIFPSIGSSILSCVVSGEDAYLARNTLRTDVHGRKTMFTHSYVIPIGEYASMMAQQPMTILGIEMESLLEIQAPGAQMSAIELPTATQIQPIEELFEKYNLTHERYFRLLVGAYLAITGRGSLQLVTGAPLTQTSTIVRELTRCIMDGLLPYLKGKVSFSSGNDPRMTISVISTAHTPNPSGDITFGVDDDGYTDVPIPDDLTQLTFATLTGLSHEQRKESLEKMQAWLEQTVDLKKAISLPLICAAYCISSGIELNTNVLLMLFRCIGNDQNITADISDSLLTYLVKRMGESGEIPADGLYMIANYYLGENSSDAYRAESDKILSTAPIEVCIALAEAIVTQPMHDRIRQMLKTLLRRIPTDDPGISDELRTNLILWVLAENNTEFIDYATVLLLACPAASQENLALGILQSTCEADLSQAQDAAELVVAKALTQAQDAILAKALGYMADNQIAMPASYVSILDQHIPAYSDNLCQNALAFLFSVRLAAVDAPAGLQMIVALAQENPGYGERILRGLSEGKNPGVWELYNTKVRNWDDMNQWELASDLKQNNTFNNPCGPFETAAMTRWIQIIHDDFSDEAEEAKFSTYNKLAKKWYSETDALHLSPEANATISHKIAEFFWRYIKLDAIYLNRHLLADERLCEDMDIDPIKITLTAVCIELHNDPKNCQFLIDELKKPDTKPQIRAALIECTAKMIYIFLSRYKFLSWDLVLCRCWKYDEKKNGPDMKLFLECCERLDIFMEKNKAKPVIEVDASILLADEQMRKTISKLSSNSKVFQKLVEVIKPERTGLFGFLKSNKKEENDRSETKGHRNGVYDPNEDANHDDRRKGKNRK